MEEHVTMPALRLVSADHRDLAADDRDQRAEAHDLASDARDAQASLRDGRSEGRHSGGSEADLGAVADRAAALRDRQGSRADRAQAADDRLAAANDRALAKMERKISSIDELTRAYRRDAGTLELTRDIDRAKRTNQPYALAFVDVDDLKGTNDSLGHAAGDQLLRNIVTSLRTYLRSYDLIVRFGGDEFVCGFRNLTTAEAATRFSLVNADLAADRTSISIGVAELKGDENLEDLITRADALMYQERQKQRAAGVDLRRGNYVNFQLADDDTARTAAAYRGNYQRLQRVKAQYDPDNLFRVNRNILPAA
jgi:diguanylate cyclase (GGDEF)-like protein